MKTSSNNNNIESKNRVINYDIEIVRDFDGTYYVNARNELHEHIKGLPEYLSYKELKKTVKEALGVTLPPLKCLTFEGDGRKQYANAYGLQGIEIHQEPLAFGLQDKVVLGSFGESRPYAIGCTVTGYRWDSEAGEFLYILQGEDGKEYADFARNIIPDPRGGEKVTLFDEQSGKAEREPASEITEFFTKGKKYRCIKSVTGNKTGRETFTKGQVYEQYIEPSAFYGWLRNNQGERHAWPQIDEMADYLETWPDTKPEDIDPRLYFEPVEDVKETYKPGLLITDTKFGLDYERITGIEEGMNTYVVTTATKIQVECMKHYRVMEKAKNEHTVADLPEWVRPGAVLMINGMWKWEEVVIVELADGCVWYKKGNSVQGWTYDHFISLYVNHRKANVKEYAPEPTLETIGKIRAAYEADGDTYPGDIEGTREYYRDALLQTADGATVCYQFGNCRFDCKKNDKGTWDVHAYDTNGEDTTFENRTASFFGGMFNDLFGTWGSGNLPEPDGGNKTNYVLEYQRLGYQEARPQEWLKKTTNEKRATYYRACVELERMAGDGLPLVIRADSADLSVNPWNALEKRVKTARVFHLGDRVKVKDGSREVTGIVNGIRCNEGSLALGGWCTHYNIQWDKQYQYTTGYGTVTGCGNIGPERIELIERAEFCPEPTSEWLQPGEKVAHYLDYGDDTGDWLTGNVTGYDLDDNGKGVTVIYGEYRTPLKGMVKYQPEMDGKAA